MEKPQGAPNRQFKFEPRKGWQERDDKLVYEGPVFKITYPPQFDGFTEMIEWANLGYHVPPVLGNLGAPTVIVVYGHIPEDFQAALEEHGVTFEKKAGKLELDKNKF